jgi:hypothetical protein
MSCGKGKNEFRFGNLTELLGKDSIQITPRTEKLADTRQMGGSTRQSIDFSIDFSRLDKTKQYLQAIVRINYWDIH